MGDVGTYKVIVPVFTCVGNIAMFNKPSMIQHFRTFKAAEALKSLRVEKAKPMTYFMIGEVTFRIPLWIWRKLWSDTSGKRVRLYNDTILLEFI